MRRRLFAVATLITLAGTASGQKTPGVNPKPGDLLRGLLEISHPLKASSMPAGNVYHRATHLLARAPRSVMLGAVPRATDDRNGVADL